MADIPADDPRNLGSVAREALGATQRAVGVEAGLPLRILFLLAVVGVCCVFAPRPFDAFGVMAVVLLALDYGRHRRA